MENGPGLKMYFLLKMGIFQPAMLDYRRVPPFYGNKTKQPLMSGAVSIRRLVKHPKVGEAMMIWGPICRVDQLPVLGMGDLQPLMTGILTMGPYKPQLG